MTCCHRSPGMSEDMGQDIAGELGQRNSIKEKA